MPQCEIYYNEDTSYGVYTFCTKEPLPDAKEYFSNQFDALYDPENPKLYSSQLAGSMQRLYVGAEYNITAEPIYNKKYGAHQFKPNSVLAITPKTVNEQKAFLQAIVTRNQADALLMAYPNIVEDVINKRDNVDLSKVKGVGNKSWKTIRDKIVSNYVISDILVMLQPLGVTYNVINKLVMSENNPSLLKHKLVDNPYMMTKIRGLGFKKVDDLALKLNPKLRQSTKRAYAYIRYYLHSVAENDGHTWVLINNLRAGAKENIPECSEEFAKIIEDEHKSEMILHFQDKIVGLKRYYESEMACLNILEELNAQPYPEIPRDVINNGIKKAEEQQGFSYTEEQKATIIKALHSNVAVICGAAGTGKSTIARGIIDSYKEYGKSISCCALSARAALRISEAAGHPASTIHRLLGIDKKTGCFMCNANNPIQADVIFLDEASMVNLDIFEALLVAIKFGSRVIICGDNKQLPPIGAGNVFSDLLTMSERFNVTMLTKVLRQAEKSGILSDANKIRNGINPLEYISSRITTGELQDMFYMFRENNEALRDIAISTFMKTAKTDGVDSVEIITPRRNNSVTSVTEINNIIVHKLFPNAEYTIFADKAYCVGAKVMQLDNDYEDNVFNGEVGHIIKIEEKVFDGKFQKVITVKFLNSGTDAAGKIVDYKVSSLIHLDLAYAVTVHKKQGGSISTAICIIDMSSYIMLDSCLLYTAITRAKKRCLLLSQPQAFNRAIGINHNLSRQTWMSVMDNK